ncbi:hypothetical protein Tco_0652690 [Tanacetum coccineum]|uniref:F5/8 type C domain-containing protein n=1 Tax=Tanacetum coccineum TaxID=301880 RepID=A0ABQ4WYB4_9ASTR
MEAECIESVVSIELVIIFRKERANPEEADSWFFFSLLTYLVDQLKSLHHISCHLSSSYHAFFVILVLDGSGQAAQRAIMEELTLLSDDLDQAVARNIFISMCSGFGFLLRHSVIFQSLIQVVGLLAIAQGFGPGRVKVIFQKFDPVWSSLHGAQDSSATSVDLREGFSFQSVTVLSNEGSVHLILLARRYSTLESLDIGLSQHWSTLVDGLEII